MRRRFLKIYQNCPDVASYWDPKVAIPFISTNLNPHPQAYVLQSLVEIGLVVLEKKIF